MDVWNLITENDHVVFYDLQYTPSIMQMVLLCILIIGWDAIFDFWT